MPRNEYVVQITDGDAASRRISNPRPPTGEVEVHADQIKLLNPVRKQMPFPVEQLTQSQCGKTTAEISLFDFRDRTTHNMQLRHQVAKAIRRYLEDKQGFIEVETPILTCSPKARITRTQPRQSYEWFAFDNHRNCSNSC